MDINDFVISLKHSFPTFGVVHSQAQPRNSPTCFSRNQWKTRWNRLTLPPAIIDLHRPRDVRACLETCSFGLCKRQLDRHLAMSSWYPHTGLQSIGKIKKDTCGIAMRTTSPLRSTTRKRRLWHISLEEKVATVYSTHARCCFFEMLRCPSPDICIVRVPCAVYFARQEGSTGSPFVEVKLAANASCRR